MGTMARLMTVGSERTRCLRFLVSSTAVTLGLILVGYLPSRHWAGPEAVTAMIAGCAISYLASVVGALPLLLLGPAPVERRTHRAMAGMGLRMAFALMLGTVVATNEVLEKAPFLISLALSYLVLLVTDTRFSISRLHSPQG